MNAALAELMTLDREELARRWQAVFGCPAPARCREELLRQALAWQLQAEVHGGLSAVERRRLRDAQAPVLAVGSRLVRVWQGETHQVMVQEHGFGYAGRQWKSLTAIAREITGTPWSGPAFFGLRH